MGVAQVLFLDDADYRMDQVLCECIRLAPERTPSWRDAPILADYMLMPSSADTGLEDICPFCVSNGPAFRYFHLDALTQIFADTGDVICLFQPSNRCFLAE